MWYHMKNKISNLHFFIQKEQSNANCNQDKTTDYNSSDAGSWATWMCLNKKVDKNGFVAVVDADVWFFRKSAILQKFRIMQIFKCNMQKYKQYKLSIV